MSMSQKHDASERLELHVHVSCVSDGWAIYPRVAKTACPKSVIGRDKIPTTRIRSDVAPITPCHDFRLVSGHML